MRLNRIEHRKDGRIGGKVAVLRDEFKLVRFIVNNFKMYLYSNALS
jgi:hypothetical protein